MKTQKKNCKDFFFCIIPVNDTEAFWAKSKQKYHKTILKCILKPYNNFVWGRNQNLLSLMHLFNEWVDSVHLSEWSVHESADSMKQTLVNSLLEEKISVNDVIVTQSYCIPLEDYRPQTEQKKHFNGASASFLKSKRLSFFHSLHAVHCKCMDCKHNSSLFMKSYKFGTTVYH